MKNIPWENVYVFISSTFNDMHAERDYLVKRVFPELSEWCAARRLRLMDIDLRWGVTEKDSRENKRVVDVCLSGIDRCRPLFLCFLGQRRGWVPDEEDIAGATFSSFPKLKQYLGSSVTEMEIIHAIIDPMLNGSVMDLKNRERAFFFMRDGAYLSDITDQAVRKVYTNEGEPDPASADEALRKLRETILETGRPVHEYTALWDKEARTPELISPGKDESLAKGRLTGFSSEGKPLSEVVLEELKQAIGQLYPGREDAGSGTPLQKELDEQARFLQTAREGFIERAGDFEKIEAYLEDGDRRPLALCAPAGMGKTSYLAKLAEKLTQENRMEVLYRFIGTSEGSVSLNSMLVFIAQELQGRFAPDIVPDTPQKIRDHFYSLLADCVKEKPLVLIIDAVNQLDSGLDDLTWIPEILPEKVKLIYSFKRGDPEGDALYRRLSEDGSVRMHTLIGFEELSARAAIVKQYLSQYLKELDDREIRTIISLKGAANPLYMKILLSELKIYGSFEGLHDLITTQFGNTASEAFDGLLKRIEADPGYSPVAPKDLAVNVFGWLSHAKNGLEAEELAGLLVDHQFAETMEDARDSVRLILRQIRPFLAKRDTREDFFYESFLLAARRRYRLPENGGKEDALWHKDLADYFRKRNFADVRKLSEQAYQAAHAGMGSYLQSLLTTYSYLERRIYHTGLSGLLEDFSLVTLPEAQIDEETRRQLLLIREALEQGGPVIAKDISQLSAQLYGRLMGFDLPAVHTLLSDTERFKEKYHVPWFRPLCTILPRPGSRIIRYFKTQFKNCSCMFRDRKRMILYVQEEKAVQTVEIRTGRVLRSYPFAKEPEWLCLAEEKNILAVRETYAMFFLDLTSGKTYPAEGITTFSGTFFSTVDDMIVTTGTGERFTKTVYVSRITTGELLYTKTFSRKEDEDAYYSCFFFDPQSGYLLQTVENKGAAVLDPARGFQETGMYRNLPENIHPKDGHSARIFFPEGTPFIVTVTEFDGLTVYHRESREVLMNDKVYNASSSCLAFSGDGKRMVRASQGYVYLYSLDTFQKVRTISLDRHTDPVSAAALSRDSRTLYISRRGGRIEVYDTGTGDRLREYGESRSPARELFIHEDGDRMVSFNLNEVLIWDMEKETAVSGPGLSEMQFTAVALSPDGRFLIGATNSSDGGVYRIDIPSMSCRKLVGFENSFFLPDTVIISGDAGSFAVRMRLNRLLFYSCETGEPLGECQAVDSDNTGEEEAKRMWDPVFLPKELSLGERGLTFLYRQNGNIVIQDPDTPEKTRVIRAFEAAVRDMKPFDEGKKLAVYAGTLVYSKKGSYREIPDLDEGAKIYDLKTLACLEETKDRGKVFLETFEMKDRPVFAEYAAQEYKKQVNLRRIPEQIFREGSVIYYYLQLMNVRNRYTLFRSDAKKSVCCYVNEGNQPVSVRLHTSDGRYYFLLFGTRLCAFELKNAAPD